MLLHLVYRVPRYQRYLLLSSLHRAPLALPFVAVQKSLPSPAAPGRDATCARGALAPAAPQHGDRPSSSAHHAASSALQPTTSLLRLLRVCSLCFASHARSRLASAWILRSLAGVRTQAHSTTLADILADAQSGLLAERLSHRGLQRSEVPSKVSLFTSAAERLLSEGVSPTTAAVPFWVPGRIEIVGKHTDYAGGRSLLCAAPKGLAVVSCRRTDSRCRLYSSEGGIPRRPVEILISPQPTHLAEIDGWARHAAIATRRLSANFALSGGADVAFESDLPEASGMSSSSAIVCGSFLAIAQASSRRVYVFPVVTPHTHFPSVTRHVSPICHTPRFAHLSHAMCSRPHASHAPCPPMYHVHVALHDLLAAQ